MLAFHPPEQKTGDMAYSKVCIVGRQSKPVRVLIPFTQFVSMHGQVLRIWLPEDSSALNTINGYDDESLMAVETNNTAWFSNTLTSEQIRSFFRPSISHSTISLLVSDVKTPQLYYNRDSIDTLDGVNMENCRLSAEIEIQGLYYFRKRVGLRWILRVLRIETNKETIVEGDVADKTELESTWADDLASLALSVDKDISTYTQRIIDLAKFKADAYDLLSKAKECQTCSAEWNEALMELSKKTSKYYNGSLFYL